MGVDRVDQNREKDGCAEVGCDGDEMHEDDQSMHRAQLVTLRPPDCKTALKLRVFATIVAAVAKPIDPDSLPRLGQVRGEVGLLADNVVVTRVDKAIGWARKYSIFPYPFATACCAMEYMSLSMAPYDIDRFGALLPRFSPRQADLLMVIGTVTVRQGPILQSGGRSL